MVHFGGALGLAQGELRGHPCLQDLQQKDALERVRGAMRTDSEEISENSFGGPNLLNIARNSVRLGSATLQHENINFADSIVA